MQLNCDLGETERIDANSIEHQVMPHIDMANIACGFHAGNQRVMRDCMLLAQTHGVQIGAHPAYPDRENFGRQSMALGQADIADIIYQQLSTMQQVAEDCGCALDYVKPHGALYNDMLLSPAVLAGVLQGVAAADAALPIMMMATPANAEYQARAAKTQQQLMFEAFSDRRYTDQGRLQSRDIAGAVFDDASQVLAQVDTLLAGFVHTANDKPLPLVAESLCVHGDNAASVALIATIRARIDAASSAK